MRFFLLVDTSNKAYFPLVFIKKIFSGKKNFFSGFTKTFITFLFWWISQYNIAWKIVETLIYNIQKTAGRHQRLNICVPDICVTTFAASTFAAPTFAAHLKPTFKTPRMLSRKCRGFKCRGRKCWAANVGPQMHGRKCRAALRLILIPGKKQIFP